MSINLQRAERKTKEIEPIKTTPLTVGPGTYNPLVDPREAREK